jgi:putative tricarboxylic transport membrane protein
MSALRRVGLVVSTAVALAAVAACGSSGGGSGGEPGGDDGGSEAPPRTEVVTHNDVGGGSDVFIRQFIKILADGDIIDHEWPVRNVPAGDSIGAMSYMVQHKGDPNVIAQMTPTWLATPMTVSGANVHVSDLTPIALIATEPQVVAVQAGSDYTSLKDFIDAAKASPNTLVQSGGSSTANDALTRLVLQQEQGAKWKFLSFEGTVSRITALLRGDADMMMGSASDFSELVKAGKLEIVTVIGDEKLDIFPDAGTSEEQGIDSSNLPVQFRGIVGAPDMPDDAVSYYQDTFREMTETDGWKQLTAESGLVTSYMPGDEFSSYLEEQTTIIGDLLQGLGLRKDQ